MASEAEVSGRHDVLAATVRDSIVPQYADR
jgi:hypothetical protein